MTALEDGLTEKLYGFCYARCRNHQDAEDLCQEILLELVKTGQKDAAIEYFEGYYWKIARNVYADFCRERRKRNDTFTAMGDDEGREYTGKFSDNLRENPIERLFADEGERERMNRILSEISILGRIYRDVMVMYYLEERKISEIAAALGISGTTVKQRLFTARNLVKEEVRGGRGIYRDAEPVHIISMGTGSPYKNNPWQTAERLLSRKVLCACRQAARRAGELSKELGVPLVYIEDELALLSKGANGEYGLLRREGEAYQTNVILIDESEAAEVRKKWASQIARFMDDLKRYAEKNGDKIQSLQQYGRGHDVSYWNWCVWAELKKEIFDRMREPAVEKHGDAPCLKRPYTAFGVLTKKEVCSYADTDSFGMDIFCEKNILSYKSVCINMYYGKYIKPAFEPLGRVNDWTGQQLFLLKCIGGRKLSDVPEEEMECAAKAVAGGYVVKCGDTFYPAVFTCTDASYRQFAAICREFLDTEQNFLRKMEDFFEKEAKRIVPKRLYGDLPIAVIALGMTAEIAFVDAGIANGFLSKPGCGAEGMMVYVE